MTHVLHRLTRRACPTADRPWLDALFAELDAVKPGRARAVWLLGAFGLVAGRQRQRLSGLLSPASLVCLLAAATFAVMGYTQYEGLAIEDDWYPAISAALFAILLGLTYFNLKHRPPEVWP